MRDGVFIAVVPGSEGRWTDPHPTPGMHTWSAVCDFSGCLSPASTCSLNVKLRRVLFTIDDFTLKTDGSEAVTYIRAALPRGLALRGFSLGVTHKSPLELVSANLWGTDMTAATSVQINASPEAATARVVFDDIPKMWPGGEELALVRLTYRVKETGTGTGGLSRKITFTDHPGDPSVPVRFMNPAGEWEEAAIQNGSAVLTEAEGLLYRRGYVRGGGSLDISAAVFILSYLFAGGEPPECMASADVNADTAINIADAVYLLAYLFGDGRQPSEPFETPAPCP